MTASFRLRGLQRAAPPPPAGVVFGTPVANDLSSRSSFTLVMSGVTTGQPILVLHHGYSGMAVSTVADDFTTPYAWTQVDAKTSGSRGELWIGTGGVGTSGTITVTAVGTQVIGGIAVPCTGASTASGLTAIDVHGNNSGTASANPTGPSLTPSTTGEGAIYTFGTSGANPVDPTSPWSCTDIVAAGNRQAGVALYPSPPASALAPVWTLAASNWQTLGAVVKAA